MTSVARETEASENPDIVRRHGGLLGRTVLVSLLTLLSRVLGFVREVLTAFLFGDTSAVSDAFFTAWRVPNLFRRLFGEGALSTSLQTALTEADHDAGPAAGRRLVRQTARITTALLVPITVGVMVLVLAAPDRMPGTGWPWLGADPGPVRDLTVRVLPFVLFVCLAALAAGALQGRGHFLSPNLAPVVMNVVWIGTLLVIARAFAGGPGTAEGEGFETQWRMARWLAWGVLLGGLLQLVVQLPALSRNGFLGAREGDPGGETSGGAGAGLVLRRSLPLALGAAVYQINVMIDGLMAEGLLPDGGPSALYYANRVQQFPLALVAIAATNAVFPSLKALAHVGRRAELGALHRQSQLGVAFLALPAGAGLFALAAPIAFVLFAHGNYGAEGAERIGSTLRVLAFALFPAGAVGLVGRVYYAVGDFRTPVWISSALLVVNALLNVAFVRGLGMDADGLALATTVTSWANLALLLPGLRRHVGERVAGAARDVTRRLAAITGLALVSGGLAWAAHRGVARLASDGDPSRSVAGLAAGAAAGLVAYLGAAALLRLPEWRELQKRLARRRKRPS